MNSGKPRDQALAVAYSVKRKNAKKKMAKGGLVEESAKSEHRPMPSAIAADSKNVSQNSANKAPHMDKMTDQPERMQTRPKRLMPLKHPKMAGSDAFSVRLRDMRDEEDDMIASMPPRKMAEGGMMRPQDEDDMAPDLEVSRQDDEEMAPPVDEYMAKQMARGGMIDEEDEMMDEDDSSIAAACMAKRRKMAEGGMVDIDSNGEEEPNGYYARNEDAVLKENYDSDMDDVIDPIESDEHSPEHDDEDINDADIVAAIRRKMKSRSPIAR